MPSSATADTEYVSAPSDLTPPSPMKEAGEAQYCEDCEMWLNEPAHFRIGSEADDGIVTEVASNSTVVINNQPVGPDLEIPQLPPTLHDLNSYPNSESSTPRPERDQPSPPPGTPPQIRFRRECEAEFHLHHWIHHQL